MSQPWGYRWRSSKSFVATAIVGALFLNTFLYSFIVPILSEMLEGRLHIKPSKTQALVSSLLAIHGILSMVSGPIIGHFADKTSKKKILLVVSVAGYLPGTVLIACTPALWLVYIGRVIQAVAGSGVWIVGFSALTEISSSDNLGSLMGLTMSFVTGGVIVGPMAGGALLHLLGYWPAWGICLAMIGLDFIALVVMIIPHQDRTQEESDPLISREAPKDDGGASSKFYSVMVRDARAWICLAGAFGWSLILSSFDATLPLHVRDIFSWDVLVTGAMFACLQGPALLLNPLAGWLRDRIGLRGPTTAGFALLTPFLLLLGTPGFFTWASPQTSGKAIYIASLAVIGALSSLVVSIAPLGLTQILNEYEAQDPYIFGPQGGSSRIFSTEEIAWTGGLIVGPLLTGLLNRTVGYFWMNLVLAVISLFLAIGTYFCLAPNKFNSTRDGAKDDVSGP